MYGIGDIWDVECSRCAMFTMRDIGQNAEDIGCLECGYSGCGMLGMGNVKDVGCWKCQMFKIMDVQDVCDVRDVRCLGCGMLGMWNVEYE